MLACRRLFFPQFSFLCARPLSTQQVPPTSGAVPTEKPDSIFSPKSSPWDRVFDDIESTPPSSPSPKRNTVRTSVMERDLSASRRTRRLAMTAREVSAFDEMFNLIFDAVSSQKDGTADAPPAPDPLKSAGIGPRPGPHMADLFGSLRRQSKRLKWTTQFDEELDRKKEEMDMCDTDQQLLEWAMREVFGESQKYEEAARKAMADSSSGSTTGSTAGSPPSSLQPATYPHLVALLMSTFRDKYADPHLALSIFDYTRHLSIPSYVFGCTTAAYNELVETRWACFRDLRGVLDALEEMKVNGVPFNARTRLLVEGLRREVGERNTWEEDAGAGRDGGEVWVMLRKIEELAFGEWRRWQGKGRGKAKKGWSGDQEWKSNALEDGGSDDDWAFDRWNSSRKDAPKARRRSQIVQGDADTARSPNNRQTIDDWLDVRAPEKLEYQ
ncbi:hypothetical protein BJ138DRAFT_808238 [Hygrophoropsis aurantiaca]|uniref:Uncharacterized protein n=1 Tax=Hygrophoropsis aurantiaca TaxID=72124 RepID=A0ACB8AH07_9AGAM|nr:hypothetical protein BJ138DRAFT_808238 [Hygrophoropsis aurantiaca]